MATAMFYDTLKLAEQLEQQAGFDAVRARAMAHILAENAGGNLVTREDLLVTKGELVARIHAVEAQLEGLRGDMEAQLEGLRGDMEVQLEGLRGDMEVQLEGLRGDMEVQLGGLRADMDAQLGGLRGDMDAKHGGLRGDIRVLYWMTGTTLAGVTALLGIAITVVLHVMHLE